MLHIYVSLFQLRNNHPNTECRVQCTDPAFHGTGRFITLFTTACHWSSPRPWVIFRNELDFYVEELLATCPSIKPESYPFSAVCDCLFNILAAFHHTWRPSAPRKSYDVVPGTHITSFENHESRYSVPFFRGLPMQKIQVVIFWVVTPCSDV
jgi:hypothetical protein